MLGMMEAHRSCCKERFERGRERECVLVCVCQREYLNKRHNRRSRLGIVYVFGVFVI